MVILVTPALAIVIGFLAAHFAGPWIDRTVAWAFATYHEHRGNHDLAAMYRQRNSRGWK